MRTFAKWWQRAQAFMERRAPQATRPAIVLDIDGDASLSNWPAHRANGRAGPSSTARASWTRDRAACVRGKKLARILKALEPTLTLARRAKTLGIVCSSSLDDHPRFAPQPNATCANRAIPGTIWCFHPT